MSENELTGSGLLTVDHDDETPLYRQIIRGLRRQIAEGLLPPGTPLPSVRQLAGDLEINPNTVSKSYLLLERDGILVSRRRRGTYVAEGARDRARAGDRVRLDEVVSDFLAAGRELGLSRQALLTALSDRIDDDEEDGGA